MNLLLLILILMEKGYATGHVVFQDCKLDPYSVENTTFTKGFTLLPSKSRGRGIEWPNFVECLKERAENSQ
jgi:hypothetical protein